MQCMYKQYTEPEITVVCTHVHINCKALFRLDNRGLEGCVGFGRKAKPMFSSSSFNLKKKIISFFHTLKSNIKPNLCLSQNNKRKNIDTIQPI